MAVPSSNSHLKNTTGGAFSAQRQGGAVLGNTTSGDVITKALPIKDALDADARTPLPIEKAYPVGGGLHGTQKIDAAGDFAYSEAGKYVIRTISSTIAGQASTALLINGDREARNAIHQHVHDFGAGLLSKWRANEFAWTGKFSNGNPDKRRVLWLDAAGTAVELPATLTGNNPVDPVAGTKGQKSDSAANPTAAIPGELVFKVDFVDVAVATGGDYHNYKARTNG